MDSKTVQWIYPSGEPTPIFHGENSTYPESLQQTFENGMTRYYRLVVKQPKPMCAKVKGLLERIPAGPSDKGYRYQPKHAKKNRRWWHSIRFQKK